MQVRFTYDVRECERKAFYLDSKPLINDRILYIQATYHDDNDDNDDEDDDDNEDDEDDDDDEEEEDDDDDNYDEDGGNQNDEMMMILMMMMMMIKALFINGNHVVTNDFQWTIIWKGIYKKDRIYTDI